jgi:hypothetical protein
LFGVGKMVLGWWVSGIVYLTIATLAGLVILRSVRVGSEE